MPLDVDTIQETFALEKTAVNHQQLSHRIAANLQAHQLQTPKTWASFALPQDFAAQPVASAAELKRAFEQAAQSYDQIWVENAISASGNSLITRIKRLFHQLVIFYVNLLGQRQIKFNDRMLRLAQQLIIADAQKAAEIENLCSQVDKLQKQIQQLEQQQHE